MLRARRTVVCRAGLAVAVRSVLCAAGLLLGGGPAEAQQATPIKVEAKVESPSLIRAWGQAESEEIAAELTEHVTQRLSNRFRHWDFAPNFQRFYAVLELRIHESAMSKVDMVLDRLGSSGQRHTLWRQVWLKPTDFALGRRPPRSQAAERLKNKFSEVFDETRQQLVENWLHEVPLGARGRWVGVQHLGTLRVVTSLPWQRFAGLERSRLKLSCKRQGREIEVESRATDEPDQFSDSQIVNAYDALVLVPETISDRPVREADLQDLIQYKVRLIFLLEELEPVDDEFFALSG